MPAFTISHFATKAHGIRMIAYDSSDRRISESAMMLPGAVEFTCMPVYACTPLLLGCLSDRTLPCPKTSSYFQVHCILLHNSLDLV